MFFMLKFEYQESNKLIIDNQRLMRNTVVKTLTNNITDKLSDFPHDLNDLESNWKKLPLNFMANYQEQWIFPSRFGGKKNDAISELWKSYQLELETLSPEFHSLTIESQSRITALNKVRLALKTKEQTIISQRIDEYFSLVENYRLSVLEELISSLRFLQLDSDARWNNQLIELMIFKGSHQIMPLTEIIFRQNKNISMADLKFAISKIQLILESANINSGWLNQSVNELWKPELTININTLKNYAIINNQWISIKKPNGLILFLPFSIEAELSLVTNTLKSQGILNNEDYLSLTKNNFNHSTLTIQQIPIEINRAAWQKQSEQQDHFFMIKISLALILIICLLVVVGFISYRNKRKMAFIALRENFVNLVSHELKTPLASIRIMIETLQKRNERQLSIKNYPDKIVKEVDRLWLMVDNLLSLNQIKSGELQLNLDKVNLHGLLNRVYQQFNEHSSVQLEFINNLAEDAYSYLDPVLFELVIINLFSNSIKYNQQTTIKIEVRLDKANMGNNDHQLIFSDNGCGIDPANWERVFNDFYREKNNSSKQGTGLGLSLCKQIMMFHQGNISIKHSDDTGTVWVIDLPDNSKQTNYTQGGKS